MTSAKKFEKDKIDRESGLIKKSAHPPDQACRKERITDYALVPLEGIERIAKRYMLGDVRYGRDNWKRGGSEFLYDSINHAIEHLNKYAAGDSSEDHLGAVGWFVTMMAWHERKGTFKSPLDLYKTVGESRKLQQKMRED